MKDPDPGRSGAGGDWLLVFDPDYLPTGGRTDATWSCAFEGLRARLWLQEPDLLWAGSPWQEVPGDHGEVLWIQGEVFGGVEKARELACGHGETPDADPWGHFLLLCRNRHGHGQGFTVTTDRFGTLHAYIAGTEDRRIVGSSFRAVARAAESLGVAGSAAFELDWLALAGFFQYGFFPADRTFFPHVRMLRPGHRLVLDAEGRERDRHRWWSWHHRPDPTLSFDDAVDELDHRLRRVMADLVADDERVAVPISGGLDSRSTVATLPAEAKPWCYSYGWPSTGTGGRFLDVDSSPEVNIARRVARARGLPFEAFAIGPYLFDEAEAVMAASEGFQDPTQIRQVAVRRVLAERSERVIAAHWGDVWLDDLGLAGDPGLAGVGEIDAAAFLDHALGRMAKGAHHLMIHLVEPNLRSNEIRPLQRLMGRELEPLRELEDPDFRLKAFKTEQWSWRLTVSGLRAFQGASFPRLPFYDARVSELFEKLPSTWLRGRRLQVEFLKRHAPDLARVPWQVYGADLYRYRHFHTWMLPERALRKLWRMARRRRVTERNWEVQFAGAGRERLRSALLAPGHRLHELMPRRAVEELLTDFGAAPSAALGYQVSMLLGFAWWLERT